MAGSKTVALVAALRDVILAKTTVAVDASGTAGRNVGPRGYGQGSQPER